MRHTLLILWTMVFSATPGPATDVRNRSSLPPVPYPVRVSHPSLNAGDAEERTLFQVRDAEGNLVEYNTDVDSVICGGNQCEVITVRLTWDPLGHYVRYALPEGGELTKRGHQTFSQDDYRKLQRVLSDRDSMLKNIEARDVVSPAEAQEGDEVDGMTGATLLLSDDAIVTGAVYTCYTLWHWANGGVRHIARDLSGQDMSDGQLARYMHQGTEAQAAFAMEELGERKAYDAETAAGVLRRIRDGSDDLAESGLAYFENLGADAYYRALQDLFQTASSERRVLYLTSLTATEREPPPGFLTGLSAYLPELQRYLEVHLLIGLLTHHGAAGPEITAHTIPLLEHDSFLIARRACSFLEQRRLTEDQKERLDAFKGRYAGRL